MTPLLGVYRTVTALAAPGVPWLLQRRTRAGKEDPARRHERLARNLPPRPAGQLLWCHGASVGESLMLEGFITRLKRDLPGLAVLYTSQTLTAARLLAPRLTAPDRHQFAPVDTPGATARFLDHWRPDAAIFAEGEIWPNLLMAARRRALPMALINARTTDRSLRGWSRFPHAARHLYGAFGTIIAADQPTAEGLTRLLGRPVDTPGNLKAALPPPDTAGTPPPALADGRPVLLAASTHPGEEILVHAAWRRLPAPRPHLVIAPRHPDRAGEIRAALEAAGATVTQRSRGETPVPAPAGSPDRGEVYLADTLGEMGLWYRLADLVYLGGGHAPGIGGHNPMEPLRCGRPVITGPDLFNFQTVRDPLIATGGLTMVADAEALAVRLAGHFSGTDRLVIDAPALAAFFAGADAPMTDSLAAVKSLLGAEPAR